MGLFKDIGKMGLLISFIAAVAYELTGTNSLKVISIVTGILSLSILTPYLIQLKNMNKARDVPVFLRLLK